MAKTAGKHTTIFINDALMTTTRPGPAWFWRTWYWLRGKGKAPWKYANKEHIQVGYVLMDEAQYEERVKIESFDVTLTWTHDEDEVHDERPNYEY